jgi:hypothetical protein
MVRPVGAAEVSDAEGSNWMSQGDLLDVYRAYLQCLNERRWPRLGLQAIREQVSRS